MNNNNIRNIIKDVGSESIKVVLAFFIIKVVVSVIGFVIILATVCTLMGGSLESLGITNPFNIEEADNNHYRLQNEQLLREIEELQNELDEDKL